LKLGATRRPRKTEMSCAQNPLPITTNTQGWQRLGMEENRDGCCPNPTPNHSKHPRLGLKKKTEMGGAQNPSPNHNKYPKAGDSKKTEMGGAGMHLAITTPTALFGTKERVVVPIEEETKERRFASNFLSSPKKQKKRKKEKKNGRKLKKTQRDRGKERFVWMNGWMDEKER